MGNLKAVLRARLLSVDDVGVCARQVAALIDEAALAIQSVQD